MRRLARASSATSGMGALAALCLFILILVSGVACGGRGDSAGVEERVLKVAVASNMRFAFPELGAAYSRAHAGVAIEPVYGSTGNFVSQISSRAPFDVFLAADEASVRRLIEEGHAAAGSEVRYASGRLALWVRADSPIDVSEGYGALRRPDVRKVAIANPKVAPYGVAAEEALTKAGVIDRMRERLVIGENIAQTVQFVDSGGAEIGVVALSLALAPELKRRGRHWEIPEADHAPIVQAACVVGHAANRADAESFMAFLESEDARVVLRRHGFAIPAGDEGRE